MALYSSRCVYRRFGRRHPANRGGMTAYPELIRYPYLTVAMMPPESSAEFRMVNHQLARRDLLTGNIHLVSHLKGTFF
jgi:hypothetical protein